MSKDLGLMYSMSRKKKMAKGGDIKGVNKQSDVRQEGTSEAGHHAKYRPSDKDMTYPNAKAKEHHKQTLSEMRSMPKPKLQGLAEGGPVKPMKGGVYSLKEPGIAQGATFKSHKRQDMDQMERDEERDLMESEAPASPMEEPKEEMDEEGADRQGPPVHEMKMMAEGGRADADHIDEEELEHASSLAAAIMAKRKMMAEGGMADLDMNADEEPNHEDDMSFEALKKENYDEGDALADADQPEDSNEHSPEHDAEDIDDKDLVSAIRRKMKSKSPISK